MKGRLKRCSSIWKFFFGILFFILDIAKCCNNIWKFFFEFIMYYVAFMYVCTKFMCSWNIYLILKIELWWKVLWNWICYMYYIALEFPPPHPPSPIPLTPRELLHSFYFIFEQWKKNMARKLGKMYVYIWCLLHNKHNSIFLFSVAK